MSATQAMWTATFQPSPSRSTQMASSRSTVAGPSIMIPLDNRTCYSW
ncbi:hypothetical protein [Amycolatopsis magusensis]